MYLCIVFHYESFGFPFKLSESFESVYKKNPNLWWLYLLDFFFLFSSVKILLLNYTFAVTEPEFFSGSYTKFGQNEEILMLLMETCELSILALTQNF